MQAVEPTVNTGNGPTHQRPPPGFIGRRGRGWRVFGFQGPQPAGRSSCESGYVLSADNVIAFQSTSPSRCAGAMVCLHDQTAGI